MHFLSAFQKYSFKICSLVTKKLKAVLEFFSQTRLFSRVVPYPLNYYLFKVTTFHGVKNENAWTKKLQGGAPGLRIALIKIK